MDLLHWQRNFKYQFLQIEARLSGGFRAVRRWQELEQVLCRAERRFGNRRPASDIGQASESTFVTPWRWVSEKGIAGNPPYSWLNVNWWYDWNIDSSSSRDLEYVAIRQQPYWPSLSQIWQSLGINTVLGYNEPDNSSQDAYNNLTPVGSVTNAVSRSPDQLATGLRIGSPATTDGGRSGWLYPFVQQADAAGYRVDFVAIHYYWGWNASDPSRRGEPNV